MAESITQSLQRAGKHSIVVIDWVAATDGSLTATAIDSAIVKEIRGKKCVMGVTNPGSTAPQADYDIAINDAEGCDIFGAELNNRSATVSQQACPKIGNTYGSRPIDSALTFALSGNNVNSATGRLKLFFE